MPKNFMSGETSGSHTALVELSGVIAPTSEASADRIITALRRAFEDEGTKGVILRINSPGGSPVQSGYINDEIKRLRTLHPETPLYAVITDICASGGYYVAAAADKIYADKASLVGSIGVLMNGFGFVELMEKLGVERRLFTAGDHKGFLDPFTPTNDEEMEHVRSMLGDIHNQFIETVKAGRGDRLKSEKDTFSGLIWTGERSVEMGLIDALGSSSYVAREIIGEENIVDFTAHEPYFEKLAKRFGASASAQFMDQMMGTSGSSLQLR
jgi:protease-4